MIVMYHQQLYNVLSTRKQKHLNHIIVLYLCIYPLMNSSMLKVRWILNILMQKQVISVYGNIKVHSNAA